MQITFNKVLVGGAGIFALVLWAALFSGRLSFKQEQEAVISKEVALRGAYVCLPHAQTSGPQTLECALGLRSDEGKHYALDMSALVLSESLATEERIEVTGLLVPIEMISSDHWRKYDIAGIMKVETFKKL